MSGYLYDDPRDCIAAGAHLRSVDNDGYCNACGHQETASELGVRRKRTSAASSGRGPGATEIGTMQAEANRARNLVLTALAFLGKEKRGSVSYHIADSLREAASILERMAPRTVRDRLRKQAAAGR
jgi:hypothetical protein